jgi:hypothetical protein
MGETGKVEAAAAAKSDSSDGTHYWDEEPN